MEEKLKILEKIKKSKQIKFEKLSITIEMLVNIWSQNINENKYSEFQANKCKIIHPNGWCFELEKFYNKPIIGEKYHRVSINILGLSENKLIDFSKFFNFFFNINLNDLYLEQQIGSILNWCQKHTVDSLINIIEGFINLKK